LLQQSSDVDNFFDNELKFPGSVPLRNLTIPLFRKSKGTIVKIDNSISKTALSPGGERKVARTPIAKTESSATPSADEVKLSSSGQLQAMGSSLGAGQPVDRAKVDAIKQAILEGRFQVNPEKIADRLLNSVQELLTNQKV
jgi:negative regulator of flagellin synthesis FlgM